MRLREIKYALEDSIPHLRVDSEIVTLNGTKYTRLTGLKELRHAVMILKGVNILISDVKFLLDTEVFHYTDDGLNFDSNTARGIMEAVNRLQTGARQLNEVLNDVIGKEKENTVYIKLPEVKDFNDLAKAADTFNKILSQSILEEEIGGKISIETVENGSIWLEVGVETAKAVALIGSITYSAAIVYREIQKAKYIAQTTRTRKIQNDKLEALQGAHKILLDHLIESEVYHIETEHFSNESPDRQARLKGVVKMLSEEMQMGAQVKPSLEAPKDISSQFPDMQNLLSLVSRVKEIGNGK